MRGAHARGDRPAARRLRGGGVTNILALGGDPPADGRPPDGDFTYAIELVEVVRAHPAGFSVGVAAHPELHPRSADRAEDRRHLAEKLALADFAITQFFFRAEDYARMLDELAALGCHRPVIAGVMPIISAAGVRRMADMNRTRIPPELSARLDRVADDPAAVAALGVETAAALSEELVACGAPGCTSTASTAPRRCGGCGRRSRPQCAGESFLIRLENAGRAATVPSRGRLGLPDEPRARAAVPAP